MKKLFSIMCMLLLAVSSFAQAEEDITSRFANGYTWNGEEKITANDDGSINFEAKSWGGIATWFGGADLSGYEKIVFEFAEATTVNTQIKVGSTLSSWGEVGITSLECSFTDEDVSNIDQIALQASAETTLHISRVYFVIAEETTEPEDPTQDKTKDLLPRFTGTWNEAENITDNADGSKEYTSAAWGGMAAWLGGVDWSEWDALVMEFADATTVTTQIKIDDFVWSEEAGVTSITADFGENDMSNVMQVALQTSDATTLMITAAYLIRYGQPAEPSYPITATWDYADTDVMANTIALSGSSESGEVDDVAKDGIKMTIITNGATFRNNDNNIQVRKGAEFQIPVNTTDDVITVKGYPSYSYYSIGGGDEITNTNDNPSTTYSPTAKEVKQGYVSIVSTNDNNYFYSISVLLNEPKE